MMDITIEETNFVFMIIEFTRNSDVLENVSNIKPDCTPHAYRSLKLNYNLGLGHMLQNTRYIVNINNVGEIQD